MAVPARPCARKIGGSSVPCFQLQERRKPRRGGLIQDSGQSRDRRRTINRNWRHFSAADSLDFRKQLDSQQRIATEIEKIVFRANRWALQHPLPNRSQYIDHCGSRLYSSRCTRPSGGHGVVVSGDGNSISDLGISLNDYLPTSGDYECANAQ